MTTVDAAETSPVSAASHRSLRGPAQTLMVLAVGVGADLALDPTQRHVPLCPLHAMTGLNCPFCGSLRAVYSLAHGQLVAAMHDNLLLVVAIPFLAVFWLYSISATARGRRTPRIPRAVIVGAVILAISFTVVRNLPVGAAISPL
jgi:hypothetical protein